MKKFYVLDENLALLLTPKETTWHSNEQDWFFIEDGIWFIEEGVVWDGATGAPDGRSDPEKPHYPITWLASLIHDLGVMFIEEDFPLTRKQVDKIFYRELKKVEFKYSKLYYAGVRILGPIWSVIFKIISNTFNINRVLPDHIDNLYINNSIK